MKLNLVITTIFLLILTKNFAQKKIDSSFNMQEVTVTAYLQKTKLINANAAIEIVNISKIQSHSNSSLVSVLNTIAGVRMEERSPGSYRLNMRGSSLRSPFGVRNIKIYFNNIPFTDPSGGTYFNQFSMNEIENIEIVKGPSSSLYGAGNGGVFLISSNTNNFKKLHIASTIGSYGFQNNSIKIKFGNATNNSSLRFNNLKANGYRQQTEMERTSLLWDANFATSEKNKINAFVFLGDLFYQTPGGLTKAEYDSAATQARPKVGTLPSAITAKAAIYQKMIYSGVNNSFTINKNFENSTSFYALFTQFKNPSIRNYEQRTEPHYGMRSVFNYKPKINNGVLSIASGIEIQKGLFNSRVYKNKNGNIDTLQTEDEITPKSQFIFLQTEYAVNKFKFLLSGSLHQNNINVLRLNTFPLSDKNRNYKNEFIPRASFLYNINNQSSIYVIIAKGFSPPTTAEVLPSTGVISTNLNAEIGYNYEVGYRYFTKNFSATTNIFLQQLKNTIVLRKDISNADFFVNAGATLQKGIETSGQYFYNFKPKSIFQKINIWGNCTIYDFSYKSFVQNSIIYDGNKLPGVSSLVINLGTNVYCFKKCEFSINAQKANGHYLNDANTFKTNNYTICNAKLSYTTNLLKKLNSNIFLNVENAFNEKYSLGNDINATGNRFYNVAANRNFALGLQIFL